MYCNGLQWKESKRGLDTMPQQKQTVLVPFY
uniref:Uncharacterized protein n=1 Tax=Anguilla anguilla TaxID=7936 RepID=A0A0E9TC29_ANGAN